jgi:DNA-binding response OmpR family regulator
MRKILIADDEPLIAVFLEKGLQKHGYGTAIAHNGYDALSMSLNGGFDLVLLDLGMPGKDGLDVLAELSQTESTLPVIVVTARDDERDRDESFKRGARHYITKPFRFSDLLVCIQSYLMT